MIAVPLTIQSYVIFGLAYGLMYYYQTPFRYAAPGALIATSNFFELALAVAMSLFGADSGATLATVVGVLEEVPIMLSLVYVCNRTRHWFAAFEETEATNDRSGAERDSISMELVDGAHGAGHAPLRLSNV